MKKERIGLGLTQAAIARQSGISEATVCKIERGAIPAYPKYREAIARVLGWQGDPAELFEEAGE